MKEKSDKSTLLSEGIVNYDDPNGFRLYYARGENDKCPDELLSNDEFLAMVEREHEDTLERSNEEMPTRLKS